MPFVNAPQTQEALTADGDAAGFVTVTSNANYYPGAYVWLIGNTTTSKRYIVQSLSGTTKVGLREVLDRTDNTQHGPQYGRTPCTQWTVADGAKIAQEPSTVYVDISNVVKVNK